MTDPTNVHEPVPQSAKLTAREKKWIIYDVGNSAFVLLSTGRHPHLRQIADAGGRQHRVRLGYAQTIASLVIALLMPLLGSIADVQGMKIKFFLGFFGTGVVTCCAMALPLTWLPFLVVYILATIGLNGSLTFYDSMLIDATSNERMDKVSSHGYGWGYIGSTVPFIFCIALIFGGRRSSTGPRWLARAPRSSSPPSGGWHSPSRCLPATAKCTIAPPVTSWARPCAARSANWRARSAKS